VVTDIVKSVLAGILVRERQRGWTNSGTHLPPFPVTRRDRARNRNVSVSSPAFWLSYDLSLIPKIRESIYATKDKVEGKRTTAKGFFFHGPAITALHKFSRLSSFDQVFKTHSVELLTTFWGRIAMWKPSYFRFNGVPSEHLREERKLAENKVMYHASERGLRCNRKSARKKIQRRLY
jgi:hypothetical protein